MTDKDILKAYIDYALCNNININHISNIIDNKEEVYRGYFNDIMKDINYECSKNPCLSTNVLNNYIFNDIKDENVKIILSNLLKDHLDISNIIIAANTIKNLINNGK